MPYHYVHLVTRVKHYLLLILNKHTYLLVPYHYPVDRLTLLYLILLHLATSSYQILLLPQLIIHMWIYFIAKKTHLAFIASYYAAGNAVAVLTVRWQRRISQFEKWIKQRNDLIVEILQEISYSTFGHIGCQLLEYTHATVSITKALDWRGLF